MAARMGSTTNSDRHQKRDDSPSDCAAISAEAHSPSEPCSTSHRWSSIWRTSARMKPATLSA